MDLELNKRNIKRIMLLIAFAALLYWGLNNLSWLSGILSGLLSLLSPLLLGICIAFVLNLMMAALERLWDRALAKCTVEMLFCAADLFHRGFLAPAQ